ncbi:MAG TPA: DJ-1/PfpI family protein [Planctomycetaceae bacterium]|nr:DJ-1/PfpI family protein [Planctomycetaceae bacterium]
MAVHVFLNDEYADWELGYLLPELVSPPDPGIKKNVRKVVTFGLTDQPVRSMGGLKVAPDTSIDQINPNEIDALILPGGMFWEKFSNSRLDDLVKSVAKRCLLVAAICAATGYLGRIGLLNEVGHTSNSLAFLKRFAPSYRGDAFYQNALAAAERGIVTASGLAPVDFTHKVLQALAVYEPKTLELWYRAFKHGEDPSAA